MTSLLCIRRLNWIHVDLWLQFLPNLREICIKCRKLARKCILKCRVQNAGHSVQSQSAHYSDVIMDTIASQITSLTIVYSTAYSDADQRKSQSSASLAFVRGIHRWPVNSPHKWPVTRKLFPFDDVIMTVMWLTVAKVALKTLTLWETNVPTDINWDQQVTGH